MSSVGVLALSSMVSGCVSLGDIAAKLDDDGEPNPPSQIAAQGLHVKESGNSWVTSYGPASARLEIINEAAGTASASVTVGGATYTITGDGGSYGVPDVYYQGFQIEDSNDSNRVVDGAIGKHAVAGIFSLSAMEGVLAHGPLDNTVVTTLPKQSANYSGMWTLFSEGSPTVDHDAAGSFSGVANFDSGDWAFNLNGQGATRTFNSEGEMIGETINPVSGTASGTITGIDFKGGMSTAGGFNLSGGEVDGRFYDPNAEELAGTIHGNSSHGKAIGTLMGHQ